MLLLFCIKIPLINSTILINIVKSYWFIKISLIISSDEFPVALNESYFIEITINQEICIKSFQSIDFWQEEHRKLFY